MFVPVENLIEEDAGRYRVDHHHHHSHHHHHPLDSYPNESHDGGFGGKAAASSASTISSSNQDGGRAPIATLSNLGNTCFLNSVVYTLRFAPNFLHNLHHLVADLALAERRLGGATGGAKAKSSSLGRNLATLAEAGARSWSSKDLPSLVERGPKSKIRLAAERMHDMYASLRAHEARDSADPYQADAFLAALRNVNPIFEGNQQQDAHELLVCLLDAIRETCRELRRRLDAHLRRDAEAAAAAAAERSESPPPAETGAAAPDGRSKPSLGILRKSWKNRKKAKSAKPDSPTKEPPPPPPRLDEEPTAQEERPPERTKALGFDFVADDFEGTTVLRTTCLECETVTERKQTMCDISVPIPEEAHADRSKEASSAVYRNACVTSECLRDQNKYWCDECARYNEARRSVSYETLPRLLVLQLKRFSGGMKKLTAHMPTPLTLACFCDECGERPVEERPHGYALYAVIMHLGQTLTGGHYVSYVRARYAAATTPYLRCDRDDKSCPAASNSHSEKPNFMKNLFARNKSNGVADQIKRKTAAATAGVNNHDAEIPGDKTDAAAASSFCSSIDCCGVKPNRGVNEGLGDAWLMCDDETVKTIAADEFDELLSARPKARSTATPYLLFYVRAEPE